MGFNTAPCKPSSPESLSSVGVSRQVHTHEEDTQTQVFTPRKSKGSRAFPKTCSLVCTADSRSPEDAMSQCEETDMMLICELHQQWISELEAFDTPRKSKWSRAFPMTCSSVGTADSPSPEDTMSQCEETDMMLICELQQWISELEAFDTPPKSKWSRAFPKMCSSVDTADSPSPEDTMSQCEETDMMLICELQQQWISELEAFDTPRKSKWSRAFPKTCSSVGTADSPSPEDTMSQCEETDMMLFCELHQQWISELAAFEIESSASTKCPLSRSGSIKSIESGKSVVGDESWELPSVYYPLQNDYGIMTNSHRKPKELGEGLSGKVYKGFRKADSIAVAIKIIHVDKHNCFLRESLQLEVEVLYRVAGHPHLLKVLDVIYSDNGQYVFIVTELCSGGDLWRHTRNGIREDEALRLFNQLVDGLEYMHRQGVIHLDLKRENILFESLEKNSLKIIDFGFSRKCAVSERSLSPILFKKEVGTHGCIAPEVLRGCYRGPEADVWSLGIVLYEMLTGGNPFRGEEAGSASQIAMVKEGLYDKCLTKIKHLSPEVRSLLDGMLRPKPEKRMTLQQVRASAWMNLVRRRERERASTRQRKCARMQVQESALQGGAQSFKRSNYTSEWATMPQRLDITEEAWATKSGERSDCGCTGGVGKLMHVLVNSTNFLSKSIS